jgi:hypothetical protein
MLFFLMFKKFYSEGMRKWAGMQASHFNRVMMLRHFVMGEECCPVLQRRDMHHSVEEGERRIDVFARH